MKIQKQGIYTRYLSDDGIQIAEVCQPPATVDFNSVCLTSSYFQRVGTPPLASYVPLAKPEYRDAIAKIQELHRGAFLEDFAQTGELKENVDEMWKDVDIQELE